MPVHLKGSCHCRRIKFELDSNTPVPYQMCQCSICRKIGGYMGSVNIMGNTDTLKITKGKEDISEYQPPLAFDKNDKPTKTCTSSRAFCKHCSSVLWNAHPEWPKWIYPSASVIDSELPKVPEGMGYTILRDSCPDYVPTPVGFKVYDDYGPGEGIEKWHKENGFWVD